MFVGVFQFGYHNDILSQTLAPGDYGAVSGISVVFQAGTFTTTVSVRINDDTIQENDEVFLPKLRYTGMDTVEITQNEAAVTILINDGRYLCYCLDGYEDNYSIHINIYNMHKFFPHNVCYICMKYYVSIVKYYN